MSRKVYQALDVAIAAKKNCQLQEVLNPEWYDKWDDLIFHIEKNYLPNGSGFDAGTKVIEDECVNGLKLVLEFGYHHMDENGYYDGWSHHKVIVQPYFDGISLKIKGALPRKYRPSMDYFYSAMEFDLTSIIPQSDIDEILGIKRS